MIPGLGGIERAFPIRYDAWDQGGIASTLTCRLAATLFRERANDTLGPRLGMERGRCNRFLSANCGDTGGRFNWVAWENARCMAPDEKRKTLRGSRGAAKQAVSVGTRGFHVPCRSANQVSCSRREDR